MQALSPKTGLKAAELSLELPPRLIRVKVAFCKRQLLGKPDLLA